MHPLYIFFLIIYYMITVVSSDWQPGYNYHVFTHAVGLHCCHCTVTGVLLLIYKGTQNHIHTTILANTHSRTHILNIEHHRLFVSTVALPFTGEFRCVCVITCVHVFFFGALHSSLLLPLLITLYCSDSFFLYN